MNSGRAATPGPFSLRDEALLVKQSCMLIEGNYQENGYALVRDLLSVDVTRALLTIVRRRVPPGPLPITPNDSPILDRPTFEIYGNQMPPLKTFLWALTPAMEQVTGRRLIPTYDYFRIYQRGDICRVHRDRPACEHSLSLTLDYSDDNPWPLDVGTQGMNGPRDIFSNDFGDEPCRALAMKAGDAVAYQGVSHRHGRLTPNPNRWSAHLFLHWVDPDGPHADQAFDRENMAARVDFEFPEAVS
jgi:hypothetical protein